MRISVNWPGSTVDNDNGDWRIANNRQMSSTRGNLLLTETTHQRQALDFVGMVYRKTFSTKKVHVVERQCRGGGHSHQMARICV